MFVSNADIAADRALYPKLKNWAGTLNLAAKKSGVATFKISGPEELLVRPRRTGGVAVAAAVNHAFRGDEEFRLSSVMLEQRMERAGIEILTIFTPVDMALMSEVASMTLPLDKAIEVFDGFEAWIDVSVVETTAAQREKARELAEVAHLPTVEETRAGDTWGSW